MDVSRYNFLCQKAFHEGLKLSHSYGHQYLEVEHVALALLRAETIVLSGGAESRLRRTVENHLSRMQKIFGNVRPKFGPRLDSALDRCEAKSGDSIVEENLLWNCLVNESTLLKTFFVKEAEDGDSPEKPKSENPKNNESINKSGSGSSKDQDGEFEQSWNLSGLSNKSSKRDDENKSPFFESFDEQLDADSNTTDDSKSSDESGRDDQLKIPKKLGKILKQYTVDLTAMAERGELDPVIGRDSEARRVLEILGRKKKNNPILIGEPGVGKTAVVEAIAQKIVSGQVAESLCQIRILSLDLGSMLAGAKYRGEFEERLKNLVNAIESCEGKVVLFIDEIHMLVGAGGAEGTADAANLLKPALARGSLKCLGATTLDEYRNYIEKDPALERRFQPVDVQEPTPEVALAILRGLKSHYEVHHGVRIVDDALSSAVDLSVKYLNSRKLPDKAIDLLDEACSRLRYQIDSVPAVMDELRSKIDSLEIERKAIGKKAKGKAKTAAVSIEINLGKVRKEYWEVESIWRSHKDNLEILRKSEENRQKSTALFENAKSDGNFDFAAKLQYSEIPKIELEIKASQEKIQQAQKNCSWLCQEVGVAQIAEVIALWAKVPAEKVLESEAEKLITMESRISARIYGQPEAVKAVSNAVRRARLGINDPNRPLGVFMFCGPTGVGKTETVKALAEELFDDESKMVRIDMSEFMEQHNVARLIGSPPGYVGYGEGGELTEPVRRNPYSIVLFDEIEKAHPRVLDILLAAIEDGRLTDGKGRLVDFRNTLMVMTSNLAVPVTQMEGNFEADEEVRSILSDSLRPEFVNRIDEVVVFRRLESSHLDRLVDSLLTKLNHRLSERQLRISLGSNLRNSLIAVGSEGQFGGRAIRRVFQSVVVDAVANRILSGGDPSAPALENTLKFNGVWQLERDKKKGYVWSQENTAGMYLPPARKSGS